MQAVSEHSTRGICREEMRTQGAKLFKAKDRSLVSFNTSSPGPACMLKGPWLHGCAGNPSCPSLTLSQRQARQVCSISHTALSLLSG